MRPLFLVCVAGAAFAAGAPVLRAQQIRPPGTGGITAIGRALARLDQNKRVLLIAAHPDDEDTEMLTLLSRGYGIDVAYLSLSRGEGGQNLIGPELGEELGLIRSGELLAARSIDGGHQYFTRAFDFGFSKTLDETLRFWPRDSLLADVMAVIRRFRPQVIVTTFSGTPRDGHGQHQVSAVIARQAFLALRDSAWGPKRLYRGARFDTAGVALTIPDATLDPWEGRSYYQLAMQGRSLHRSQDMGQLQRIGASTVRITLVDPAGGAGPREGVSGLFAGTDTSLVPALVRYRALIDSARVLLSPRDVSRLVPVLTAALRELRANAPPAFRESKEPLLSEAIAAAAGVVVDAVADDGRISPGQQVRVSASAWNAGPLALAAPRIAILAPPGWGIAEAGRAVATDGGASFFAVGRVPINGFIVTVPGVAPPTTPYFLARPRAGAMYDWSAAAAEVRAEALDPPLLRAAFTLDIAGTPVTLEREITFRYNDQALGEIRKPVVVVPAIGVAISPAVLVWPAGAASRRVQVELDFGARDTLSGFLRLEVPDGWPAVEPQPFTLTGEDTRRSFDFEVRAPERLAAGSYAIRAVADAGSVRESRGTRTLDYPHIRPVTRADSGVARVVAADIVLPRLRAVGYVRGASDMVPEALEQIGVPVRLLTPLELERADLAAYDVIVIGSRAYETDPALVANNGRLLDWVRAGGRLVVQYQQYAFIRGGFAPFRLSIGQPHDRVTDENAPVTVLDPNDPAFRAPNRIVPSDWAGWVQERGLYFAREWDPAYQPLLELGDAGERLRGGLLSARYGRGLYTYTGLAFFRELPAGVPGAYKLFLNLLARRPTDAP